MKTKLHKTLLFLLVTTFALQVQGQAFDGTPGIYKIRVNGTNLYVTAESGVTNAKYQDEVVGSDTQQFTVVAHPNGSHFSITSQVAGVGALETTTTTTTANPTLGFLGNTAGGAGQQDQWNPTRGSGTQVFLESDDTGTAWEGSAKRRIQVNSGGITAGKSLFMSGGTAVTFDWILVTALSTEDFDLSSFLMPNPVNEELAIKGIPSNVKKVAVYSLLGQEVLSREVKSEALRVDISTLKSGMYIVDFSGENGRFTKKIIKQ